jgi:hypothetical protein
VFVSWEADPLNKPGEFQRLQEVAALLDTMLQFVEVDEVRSIGGLAELAPPEEMSPQAEQSYGFEPITFYPDGSSDTAEIIFSARESEEQRQVAVQIIGTTGTTRRQAVELAVSEGGVSEK